MKEFIVMHMGSKKKSIISIIAIVLLGAILLASCTNGTDSNNTFSNGSVAGNSSTIGSVSDSSHSDDSNASTITSSSGVVSDDSSSNDSAVSNGNESQTSSVGNDEPDPDTPSNDNEVSNGSNSNGNNSDSVSNSNSNNNTSSNGRNESSNSNSNSGTVSNTGTQEHKHDYSQQIVVPPTCTEQGYTKYICNICKDSYIGKEVPKVKHNMVFNSMVNPTETTRGKYIYKCSYGCGTVENEEIYSINEYAELLAPYVLQTLNEYRAKEGAPAVKLSNAQTRYSQYRAFQLTTNFAHDPKDSHKAAEMTHVGVYYSAYTNESGKFVEEHWIGQFYGEVIQMGYAKNYQAVKSGKDLQDALSATAKDIIGGFWSSARHKEILSEKTDFQIYVGIGIYNGYVCINLDMGNQDERGYTHYWYEGGIEATHMCSEYVKDEILRFECMWPNKHK